MGENCILKSFDPSQNRHDYIKNINDPDVLKYLNYSYPFKKENYRNYENWIKNLRLGKEKFESFAIYNLENIFMGIISLRSIKGCPTNWASVGYWLGKAYWRNGVGTDSVSTAVEHASRNLNIVKLEAYVFKNNVASIRVLEKNGFIFEDVLRRNFNTKDATSDELIYSKFC
jgi:RimJ/RimL family protein N-acetyltransferase